VKVHEALCAVMKTVGAVAKTERNTQGQGYNFRGIDQVVNAVYPALVEHGVVVIPKVVDVVLGTVEVGHKRTQMSHTQLTVEFTFYGPEGDTITATTCGASFDSGDKATAKAHSVALRTCLLQTLMLPTDDTDPDSHTYERSPARSPEQEALQVLQEFCGAQGLDTREVAARFRQEIGGNINDADAASIRAYTQTLTDEVEATGGPGG